MGVLGMNRRPLLYIACPLSDMPINYLDWLARMNDEAEWAFDRGWAPLIPGNDLLFCYRSKRKLTIDDLLEIDREYIHASYAIRIIDTVHLDGRPSYGVSNEIEMAKDFGRRLCYTRPEVDAAYAAWAKGAIT